MQYLQHNTKQQLILRPLRQPFGQLFGNKYCFEKKELLTQKKTDQNLNVINSK
jgi:hypothetical protein